MADPAESWWVVTLKIVAIIVLTFLSATFSGLDLGLMSLSPAQLELIIKEGNYGNAAAKRNAKRARKILPIRKDGNLLLCTVLLGNVAVNSCMAVFLDSFAGGPAAFVVTTLLVVTFGEIIPQSLCYKHALLIGARLMPVLKVFRILFYPFNKPVAMLLDSVFGDSDHSVIMNPNQMKAALDYQAKKRPALLTRTESGLLKGALESSEYLVKDVMVPIEHVFCLEALAVIDAALLEAVSDAGYSKLPVVDYVDQESDVKHHRVVGLLHVSDLLVVDPGGGMTVKSLLPTTGMGFHTVDGEEAFLTLLKDLKHDTSQITCVSSRARLDGEDAEPFWFHSGIIVAQDVLNAIAQENMQARTGSKLPNEFKSMLLQVSHVQHAKEAWPPQVVTAPGEKIPWLC